MKRDQLANVLLKVSGFLMLLRAVAYLPQHMMPWISYLISGHSYRTFSIVSPLVGAAVPVVIGILLIRLSQRIAHWLFPEEE